MRGQGGFFDIEERLKELSAKGDTLERLNGLVDFELFRPDLERAVPRADRSRGGRPPFDDVLMFKVLIVYEAALTGRLPGDGRPRSSTPPSSPPRSRATRMPRPPRRSGAVSLTSSGPRSPSSQA